MHSVCPHDCPSACSLVVKVENGRLTEVTGNPAHPFPQGVICGKVRAYAERVHSPLRVQQPLDDAALMLLRENAREEFAPARA